jgi:hypothetical protein
MSSNLNAGLLAASLSMAGTGSPPRPSRARVLRLIRISVVAVLQERIAETVSAATRPRGFALLHCIEATALHVARHVLIAIIICARRGRTDRYQRKREQYRRGGREYSCRNLLHGFSRYSIVRTTVRLLTATACSEPFGLSRCKCIVCMTIMAIIEFSGSRANASSILRECKRPKC